jgi:DNA-binding NarL/FixJ family response regulator
VRVLLLADNTIEALAIQRELAGRCELRVVGKLSEALALLNQTVWRPDVIVADLDLPDSEGLATLNSLQLAALGIPVVVSTGIAPEALRRQLDAWDAFAWRERSGGFPATRSLHVQQAGGQSPITARIEMIAEIDRVARQAADAAVSRAIDQLLDRLGLGDEEGLRMAIRLARGWEAAKIRFVSTIATGLASAFLLAVGAGIVAMLKESGSR